MHEDYADEEIEEKYFDEISKEYDTISEELKQKNEVNEQAESVEEVKEEKKKSEILIKIKSNIFNHIYTEGISWTL